MIREVPPELLRPLWSVIAPMLTEALAPHPFLDSDDILWLALNGRAYVIAVLDGERVAGVIIMELHQYPKRRIGNILALAGEVGSMERFSDEVEGFLIRWCRENSLDSLGMLGRPGWSRVLGARGWRTQPMCVAWLPLQD
jgi:hypothetical protein